MSMAVGKYGTIHLPWLITGKTHKKNLHITGCFSFHGAADEKHCKSGGYKKDKRKTVQIYHILL